MNVGRKAPWCGLQYHKLNAFALALADENVKSKTLILFPLSASFILMKIICVKLWGIKLDSHVVYYNDGLLGEHAFFIFNYMYLFSVCMYWHTQRGQKTISTVLVLGDQT